MIMKIILVFKVKMWRQWGGIQVEKKKPHAKGNFKHRTKRKGSAGEKRRNRYVSIVTRKIMLG